MPFQDLAVGGSLDAFGYNTNGASFPVYDEAVQSRAPARLGYGEMPSTPARTAYTPANLSYGNGVPTIGSQSSTPLTYAGAGSTPNSYNTGGGFMKTATMFSDFVGSIGSIAGGAVRTPQGVPNDAIAQVTTTNVDGGSGMLSSLSNAAQGILGAMGSSGDGDLVPVSYGSGSSSGMDPLVIAGVVAFAGGLIWWATS